MTVFTIYYKADGEITGYIESGELPPESEIPKGCKRLSFDKLIRLAEPPSWTINVKVDPETLHIIPINAPKILSAHV